MNPWGEEKDEMEIDSIKESDSESTPTDQEIERPPTQSGVATSSRPNQILLTTAQRIAATLQDGNVPAFIRTQLLNLPKSLKRKSKSGLLLLTPKKRKLTHRLNPFPKPDSDPDSDTFPDTIPEPIPDPDYDADSDSDSDLNPNPDPDTDLGNSFDVIVSNSDCLPIPRHHVEDSFPYFNCNAPFTVHLTDPCCRLWPNIICEVFCEEEAFILTSNWAQYAEAFNLRVMDTVRFWPKLLLRNHFMMQHFPRPEPMPIRLGFPGFSSQNFLFQVELRRSDVGFGRLVIHVEHMKIAWPGRRFIRKQEMLKLMDFRDKNWYVRITYSALVNRFVVMDGWPGFVREHDLVAGDWVRFYKQGPTNLDRKEFLIQFVRRWPTRAVKSTIQHALDPWPKRAQN